MRNRFTYICCVLPALFLLNNVPMFFRDIWQLVVALLTALAVWMLVWLRLYHTRKLRPEFAVLTVLPQVVAYSCLYTGLIVRQAEASAIWQNLYALLWIGAAYVAIRSMNAGDWERPQTKKDSVYIMMAILTIVYSFYGCGEYYLMIFPQ